jgi:RNA-dependent RNA polymerase
MYTATAREMEAALKECRETKLIAGEVVTARMMDPEHMPLMSFPWLFYRELGKIATNCNSLEAQAAIFHQGIVHKNAKKHADVALAPEPGLGEVETTQGITHYGELLKLDFSNPVRNNQPNTHSNTKASVPLANESEAVELSPVGGAMSQLTPYSTPNTTVNAVEDAHDTKYENVKQTEKEQMKVRISLKKGSVMDKLARFA